MKADPEVFALKGDSALVNLWLGFWSTSGWVQPTASSFTSKKLKADVTAPGLSFEVDAEGNSNYISRGQGLRLLLDP